MSIDIRPLITPADFVDANRVEVETWGPQEATPGALLTVFAHHGGLVLGAYHNSEIVGVSLGFPGLDECGAPYLHSHLLAVLPAYRGQGVGEALKRQQRVYAQAVKLPYVGWTYDPLMAPNAWFNLGVLGARVAALKANAYGVLDDDINRGLPTHRFWVVWDARDGGDPAGTHGEEERMMSIPPNIAVWRRDDLPRACAAYEEWFARAQQWWGQGWRIAGVRRVEKGIEYRWVRAHAEGGLASAD